MQTSDPSGTGLFNYPTSQSSSAYQGPTNPGNDPQLHVGGYPRLAFFFSRCTRYLHLRRFSAIAVRLLFYQQHELIYLENKLLAMEQRDSNNNDPNDPSRQYFCANFAFLKAASGHNNVDEQRELYETLKHEMKEYEEALIRFDRLGGRGYGVAEIHAIQWFQDKRNRPLDGVDASVWGSLTEPENHAFDMIQVVAQSNPSAIGKFCIDQILLWTPQLSKRLEWLVFWSKKRQDVFGLYSFSGHTFDVIFLVVGNVVTSLLVYGAVTSLYFINNKAASVGGVLVIAVVISLCSILFRNYQFISMLATVCAVLVALLLNDRNPRHQPTFTSS